MKKTVYAAFILVMIVLFAAPSSSHARGGYGWGWWAPWAVVGTAAVLASPYYYGPFYAPPTVVIREQPYVYVQPSPSVTPPSAERLFIYPRQGQSEELQAKDRYACHSWAVSQTHYDPTQPASAVSEAETKQKGFDYNRAMGACLDARGYTVR